MTIKPGIKEFLWMVIGAVIFLVVTLVKSEIERSTLSPMSASPAKSLKLNLRTAFPFMIRYATI